MGRYSQVTFYQSYKTSEALSCVLEVSGHWALTGQEVRSRVWDCLSQSRARSDKVSEKEQDNNSVVLLSVQNSRKSTQNIFMTRLSLTAILMTRKYLSN